jgi:hypothetical protein
MKLLPVKGGGLEPTSTAIIIIIFFALHNYNLNMQQK